MGDVNGIPPRLLVLHAVVGLPGDDQAALYPAHSLFAPLQLVAALSRLLLAHVSMVSGHVSP